MAKKKGKKDVIDQELEEAGHDCGRIPNCSMLDRLYYRLTGNVNFRSLHERNQTILHAVGMETYRQIIGA